jgi:translation initiation factor 3 subunit E
VTQLQQRTWLIHWSLFVFFCHPVGRTTIVDMFFNDKCVFCLLSSVPHSSRCRYLNAIQTSAPHILRYLTAAVITNKRRRLVLKRLVELIQQVRPDAPAVAAAADAAQEKYTYHDPVTEFVECLYVNFDFEGAQKKLQECETVRALCCALGGLLLTGAAADRERLLPGRHPGRVRRERAPVYL